LNTTWNIEDPPSLFKRQLINFVMMVIAGLLILLSVLFTIVSNPDGQTPTVGLISGHLYTRVLANILVTVLAFTVFILLYKFIPHSRPRLRDIWAGALISTVAFEITKVIYIGYVRIFAALQPRVRIDQPVYRLPDMGIPGSAGIIIYCQSYVY
jgi:membrane protein